MFPSNLDEFDASLFHSQNTAVADLFACGAHSDYQNAPRLANPVNDASDVAASFGRLGFLVKLVENTTFEVMRRGLLEFAEHAQAADRRRFRRQWRPESVRWPRSRQVDFLSEES